MPYRWQVMSTIADAKFVAIVRSGDRGHAAELVEALIDGGSRVVELTMTTPGALDLVERFADRALVGVGTVLSAGQVAAAATAGARFIVTPNLEPEVVTHAHRFGLSTLIGCATTSEVVRALELGADAVKLFPAVQLGPDYLRALHTPIPWAPVIPTGGVSVDNAREWLDAGAVALGIGGTLCAGSAQDVRVRVGELIAALA